MGEKTSFGCDVDQRAEKEDLGPRYPFQALGETQLQIVLVVW